MPLGVLTVGSLTLNENYTIQDATNASSGKRTVTLGGIETFPGRSLAQLRALGEDIMSMFGRTVPVVFQHKTDRSGYYTVDDANVSEVHWDGEASSITWSLSLTREGPDNAVDIESRLLTVNRTKVYAGTPEPWHAPPIGHHTYFVGASTPATVTRQSVDGPIVVYRNIPAGVNPRYGLSVGSWANGRVKLLSGGILRTGANISIPYTGWELNNGLVRVKPYVGGSVSTLLVAMWDGAAWQERAWDVRIAGDSVDPGSHFQAVTVLRNGPELVVLRCLASQPTGGARVLIDLVLRRGSRILEGYVQRTVSGQISVQLDVLETFNAPANGYVIASGEDAVGLRWAAGSTGSFSLGTNGGVSYSSATAADFWIGAEVPKPDIFPDTVHGFEQGAVGWSSPSPASATFTADTANAKFGTYAGKITALGGTTQSRVETNNIRPITAGKSYVITGWLMSPVALAAGGAELTIHWFNATTYMSSVGVQTPALSAGVWTPVASAPFTAPVGSNGAKRQFALNGTPVVGAVLYADEIHIREPIDSGDTAGTLALQYAASTRETMVVVPR